MTIVLGIFYVYLAFLFVLWPTLQTGCSHTDSANNASGPFYVQFVFCN